MIQYRRLKRDLINVNTRFVDSERNSTNFFNITSIPDSFTSGKNSFKIKPNFTNLSQNYPIYIEVLDAKGYNIFHHVTDSEEADGSRIVAVYVYPTTNLGDCTVTFIGTSKVDLNKNPLDRTSIVENNIKYVHRMGVDSFKVNDNDIIFDKEPTIEISEKKYSIIEDKFSSNTKSTTKTGTVRYSLEDGVPKVFALDETFNSSYLNSTISFPYLSDNYQPLFSFQTSSFEFSASVVSVDGKYSMTLDTKLSVQGTANEVVDITTSDNQSYFLRYNTEPTKKNITQNIKNYAKIDLNELDPIVGNVTRVKIFSKSKTCSRKRTR